LSHLPTTAVEGFARVQEISSLGITFNLTYNFLMTNQTSNVIANCALCTAHPSQPWDASSCFANNLLVNSTCQAMICHPCLVGICKFCRWNLLSARLANTLPAEGITTPWPVPNHIILHSYTGTML